MLFFKKLRRLSKHKKLCEEWALANSCESVGPSTSSGSCSTTSASTSASASSSRTGPDDNAPETVFSLKYLGSTLVESPSSEEETAEAIKTIISMVSTYLYPYIRIRLSLSLSLFLYICKQLYVCGSQVLDNVGCTREFRLKRAAHSAMPRAPPSASRWKFCGRRRKGVAVIASESRDVFVHYVGNIMEEKKAKASGKKLQRVSLAVSRRGIRMTDLATEEDQLRVSIYRISYCSADATHDHVFAFIATNLNETMECHAYLCPKRKIAQNVTLTVAQAFNTAYELWQLSQLDSRMYHAQDKSPKLTADEQTKDADKKSVKEQTKDKVSPEKKNESQKNVLIDIPKEPKVTAKVESWVSFDEEPSKDDIPLKPLNSPTSSSPTTSSAILSSTTTPVVSSNRSVAPQQPKLQNAWLESSTTPETRGGGIDLVCSS